MPYSPPFSPPSLSPLHLLLLSFLIIAGMVFIYTLIQLTVWWLFHTASLFWKIQFPFHARSFRRTKCIHISCFVAGILVPLVPIIASVANSAADFDSDSFAAANVSFLNHGLGYSLTRFPPILCTGSNSDVIFYSVVMPIELVLAVGCSLLIVMFWTIHKVSPYSHIPPASFLLYSGTSPVGPNTCVK